MLMRLDDQATPLGLTSAWVFGPFRLSRSQPPQLLKDGEPVALSAASLGILAELVANAGAVVDSSRLIRQAWPERAVSDSSLRNAVASLRRALAEVDPGTPYVQSVAGRGYSFVAAVSAGGIPETSAMPGPGTLPPPPGLPSRLVGREDMVAQLRTLVDQRRLVTLLGPGGIGKTSVAMAVANDLRAETPAHVVHWVELSVLSQPDELAAALAAALGAPAAWGSPLEAITRHLRAERSVVVLDNCEHMLPAVADLAIRLMTQTQYLHLLVTSREALRIDGEWIVRLPAMEVPPRGQPVTAAQAGTYSAVRLLEKLARDHVRGFEIDEDNATAAAELCRLLDGLPLAIELAAAQVGFFGVRGLVERMAHRFQVLAGGKRTALPRHRTLKATLDWSWDLLPVKEQLLLRRLSVFRGWFSTKSAVRSVTDPMLPPDAVTAGLANLASKSLVVTETTGGRHRHRLLDTTRAYAAQRLAEAHETQVQMHRHAHSLVELLDRAEPSWSRAQHALWSRRHALPIEEIWAAIDWALSPGGDAQLGVRLAVASLPMSYPTARLQAHSIRLERAIAALPAVPASERTSAGVRLNMALGAILGQVEGTGAARTAAFERGAMLGRTQDAAVDLVELTNGQWIDAFGKGNYRQALQLCEVLEQAGCQRDSEALQRGTARMRAQSLHFLGRYQESDAIAHGLLQRPRAPAHLVHNMPQPVAVRVSMRIVLARSAWLRGDVTSAFTLAAAAVEQAETDMVHARCQALALAATPIAIWAAEQAAAHAYNERLRDEATRHGLRYWQSWAQVYEHALRAPAERARTEPPWSADTKLDDMRATLRIGAPATATLERAMRGDVGWCAPEILRSQAAAILQRNGRPGAAKALGLLRQAMALALEQGARAWALRAGIDLATLLAEQSQRVAALEVLAHLVGNGAPHAGTPDEMSARALLSDLSR